MVRATEHKFIIKSHHRKNYLEQICQESNNKSQGNLFVEESMS